MSFQDPIVGGTVLRIPAIQSPNFSITAQTGWAILQNGDAYFFDIFASGSITGASLVIDGANGGVFVYSGPPAAGNLIVSLAGTAGTDAYGNTYPEGINVSAGTISGTTISGSTFEGTDFMIDAAGLFFYSGTPAAGNLIIALARAAGTDAFGNSYAQGLTIGTFGSSQIVAGLTGGSPLIYFPTGNPGITNSSAFQAITQDAGTAEYDQLQLLGAQNTTQDDSVFLAIASSSTDGTNIAQILEFYHDSLGNFHLYRTLSKFGPSFPQGLTLGAAATALPVQGELLIANAAAPPATPAAGGALWARSGVPKWTDSSGQFLSMSKVYTAQSSADLDAFTAETAVPGATISVEVTGTAATINATGHFDMQAGAGACTLVGLLRWNGADQTRMAVFEGTTAGQRGNVGQTWVITGVVPGTYTAALYATCSVSSVSNTVKGTHTTLTVQVLEG